MSAIYLPKSAAGAAPQIQRYALVALAFADLVLLAIRLRPWPQIVNLPGEGTAASDPAICLVAYMVLMFWISGNRNPRIQKGLLLGAIYGGVAGLLLEAHIILAPSASFASLVLHMALLVGAGILWCVAGFVGARAARHFAIGIVSGAWSAMVSALLACGAILAHIDVHAIPAQNFSTWTNYEAMALGPPPTQSLLHGLIAATGFLLICPLVGGALGIICGLGEESSK